MTKRKLVAARDFKGRDGKDYKKGDRIELDESEAQELIRRGEAQEDPQAKQQPANE